MKNLREKGVTLIALVITIIILLILAAITINLVLSQNGLLTKSQEAKIESEVAKEKEILSIATVDAKIDTQNGPISNEDLVNALKNNSKEEVTVEGDGPFTVTFESSKREYVVQEDGTANRAPKHKAKGDGKLSVGDGTEENPYLIQSIEDLVTLSNKVKDGTFKKGDTVKLDRDLDFFYRGSYVNANSTEFGDINEDGTTEKLIRELTKGKGFRSIGYEYKYDSSAGNYIGLFEGTFDGQGNKIRNLQGRSLFGYVGNPKDEETTNTIKNLNLENINVTKAGIINEIRGGKVTIENCSVSGNVIGGDAGGIVSDANGTIVAIKNCKNECDIESSVAAGIIARCQMAKGKLIIDNCLNKGTVQGDVWIGGLGGRIVADAIVTNSCNKGKIIALDTGCRGGGLFSIINGNIENCYNEGEIITESTYAIGGIASQGYTESIKNCYNKGNIISTGTTTVVGGIYAESGEGATIENCYNEGNIITSKGILNIGGILGRGSSTTTINRCYNKGRILLKEQGVRTDIGGIAYSSGNITNSYNLADIEIDAKDSYIIIGGITTSGAENIENCYNLGNISVNNSFKTEISGIVIKNAKTITNCYSIGDIKISGEKQKTVVGVGPIDSGKVTLTNTYYLQGTAEKGSESVEDAIDVVEALSQSDILTKMNEKLAKLEGWKAVEGKYPVLDI